MKTILVALDGSPRARYVLSEACSLAEKYQAKLVLYRALGIPPEIPTYYWRSTTLDLAPLLLENAEKELKELAKAIPSTLGVSMKTELAVGWDGICQTAKRLNADLIVIGSHGYGGLDRILGTTASRVVNHADRSVLVIREPEAKRREGA
jgi:nucleotide-binding universal stress UspA family protein